MKCPQCGGERLVKCPICDPPHPYLLCLDCDFHIRSNYFNTPQARGYID